MPSQEIGRPPGVGRPGEEREIIRRLRGAGRIVMILDEAVGEAAEAVVRSRRDPGVIRGLGLSRVQGAGEDIGRLEPDSRPADRAGDVRAQEEVFLEAEKEQGYVSLEDVDLASDKEGAALELKIPAEDIARVELAERAQGNAQADGVHPEPLLLVELVERKGGDDVGRVRDPSAAPGHGLAADDEVPKFHPDRHRQAVEVVIQAEASGRVPGGRDDGRPEIGRAVAPGFGCQDKGRSLKKERVLDAGRYVVGRLNAHVR